jgi:hypothetical protein
MYQVYKKVWDSYSQTYLLQYVAQYASLQSAQTLAKRLRGVVKINGHICTDLR